MVNLISARLQTLDNPSSFSDRDVRTTLDIEK